MQLYEVCQIPCVWGDIGWLVIVLDTEWVFYIRQLIKKYDPAVHHVLGRQQFWIYHKYRLFWLFPIFRLVSFHEKMGSKYISCSHRQVYLRMVQCVHLEGVFWIDLLVKLSILRVSGLLNTILNIEREPSFNYSSFFSEYVIFCDRLRRWKRWFVWHQNQWCHCSTASKLSLGGKLCFLICYVWSSIRAL